MKSTTTYETPRLVDHGNFVAKTLGTGANQTFESEENNGLGQNGLDSSATTNGSANQ